MPAPDAAAERDKKLRNIDELVREDLLSPQQAMEKKKEVEAEYQKATGGGDANNKPEWTEHLDPNTGRNFYRNAKTGQTQWERPAGPVATQTGEWAELTDPNTGRTFWRNSRTGATQWERPAEDGGQKAPAPQTGPHIKTQPAPGGGAGEWQQLTDPSSGRPYWRNSKTGQSQWTDPNAAAGGKGAAAGAGEWQQQYDQASGRQYWRHSQTGESRWDPPPGAGAAAGGATPGRPPPPPQPPPAGKGGKDGAGKGFDAKGSAKGYQQQQQQQQGYDQQDGYYPPGKGKDGKGKGKDWGKGGKDWGKGGKDEEVWDGSGGAGGGVPQMLNYAPPQAFVVANPVPCRVHCGPNVHSVSPPGQPPLAPGSKVLAAQRRETPDGMVWLLLAPPHKGWVMAKQTIGAYDILIPESHALGIKRAATGEPLGADLKNQKLDPLAVLSHPQGGEIPRKSELLSMKRDRLLEVAQKYASTELESALTENMESKELANFLDMKRPVGDLSNPQTLADALEAIREERKQKQALEKEVHNLSSRWMSQEDQIQQLTMAKEKAEREIINLRAQGPRWGSMGAAGNQKAGTQAQVDDLTRRLRLAEGELRIAQQKLMGYQRDMAGIPQAAPAMAGANAPVARSTGAQPPAAANAGRGGQPAPGVPAGRGGQPAPSTFMPRGAPGAGRQQPVPPAAAPAPAQQKNMTDAQKRAAALQACQRSQDGVVTVAEEHLVVLAQQQSTLKETEAWILVGMTQGQAGAKEAAKKLMAKMHPDRVTDEKQKEVQRKRFQLINHARSQLK
eukprot:TRINITY_DN4440_c0_g1_i1.p1 TRINITY_DN4440_c0_g1~~TRINITY_DN4440_c0_g1_i1.p1  ORF type:complete len:812 (+),score=279.08 TRINITY_DN4440_c0_g1_i1:81-2438(+)